MDDELFKLLIKNFNLTELEIDKHRRYYNNNFDKYNNDIYGDIKTRIVHLLNFWSDSWFNKRYELLFSKYKRFDKIVEIGYGLPYLPLYLPKKSLKSLPELVYVDKYNSAKLISEFILRYLNTKGDFIVGDIENELTWKSILKHDCNSLLIVTIETVEHLKNPGIFWKNVSKFKNSKLIISLPIGPKIPSHYICFKDPEEVREYLNRYMVIEEERIIEPEKESGNNLDNYKDMVVFGRIKGS